jgi:hypothetical protein
MDRPSMRAAAARTWSSVRGVRKRVVSHGDQYKRRSDRGKGEVGEAERDGWKLLVNGVLI